MNSGRKELMKIVGSNLRMYREERKLTQEELSEKAGISTSFYANIECGNKSMSLMVFKQLAESLGVSADSLLYDRLQPNTRICNIEKILSRQSDPFVCLVEKLLQVCVEEDFQPGGESEKRMD